jgi:hypothetical protein
LLRARVQLRSAAAAAATLAAGAVVVLPALLFAAALTFLVLRWLIAPPRQATHTTHAHARMHTPPTCPACDSLARSRARALRAPCPGCAPCSAVRVVRPLLFDYTSSGGPVATAAFLPQRHLLNGALAPGTPPAARFLPPGQAFDITLRLVRTAAAQQEQEKAQKRCASVFFCSAFIRSLTRSCAVWLCPSVSFTQELPESPVNEGVGVFQVRASLLTAGGEVAGVGSAPAAVRYRSPLARWARAAARAPLHALGWAPETQMLTLQLFTGAHARTHAHCHRTSLSRARAIFPQSFSAAFPEQRSAPFAALRVALLPRADGAGAAPQVYGAEAVLTLRVSFLRAALHSWPLTTAVMGTALIFGAYCTAAGAALAAHTALPLLRGDAGAGGGAGAGAGAGTGADMMRALRQAPAAARPHHWAGGSAVPVVPPPPPDAAASAAAAAGAAARGGALLRLSGTGSESDTGESGDDNFDDDDDADALSPSDAPSDAEWGGGGGGGSEADAATEALLGGGGSGADGLRLRRVSSRSPDCAP